MICRQFFLLIFITPLGLYWTLILTNFAVLVTGLVEAARHNLSLYNAILISYLCTLHIFPTYAVLYLKGPPSHGPGRKFFAMNTALSILVLGSDIFGLYIWIRAKTFGNQPECNSDTLLILFGKSYSATTLHARLVTISESLHVDSLLLSESLVYPH